MPEAPSDPDPRMPSGTSITPSYTAGCDHGRSSKQAGRSGVVSAKPLPTLCEGVAGIHAAARVMVQEEAKMMRTTLVSIASTRTSRDHGDLVLWE